MPPLTTNIMFIKELKPLLYIVGAVETDINAITY